MDKLTTLRQRLSRISPAHDYPVGLMHPYWARKPFNVISEIIACLTEPGERVADPFMGSGTVLFSALAQEREVLGSDLNPLAVFIVSTLLDLGTPGIDHRAEARRFLDEFSSLVLEWYRLPGSEQYLERERFTVEGTFEEGEFSLVRTEVVAKGLTGGRWTARRVIHEGVEELQLNCEERFLSSPLDFDSVKLTYNSRIAIPRGARLSHFYTRENRAAVNAALGLARKRGLPPAVRNLRLLLLSSALPLLRLSDKKASSQWPYWRPKKMLTSRNPVIVLGQRVKGLLGVIDWLEGALPRVASSSGGVLEFQTEPLCRVTVQGISCQRLGEREEEQEQYHLVLTDPPYSDHVPYLEYSALWTEVLGLPVPARSLREEIVNSDSPERRVDSGQYARRLGDGFDACARLVRPGGYLVWFYNDTALGHWLEISNRARACGVGIMDVIAIPKQRRSMKTVTSPDRTLDGDLICVFQKGRACADGGEDRNLEQVMAHLRQGLARGGDDMSHFERYALLIKEALLWGGIAALEARYGKVTQVLKELNG